MQAVAYSPDGTHLCYGGRDAKCVVLDNQNSTDSVTLDPRLPRQNIQVEALAWKSDSRVFAGYSDGFVRLWDLHKPHQPVSEWLAHRVVQDKGVWSLSWNPERKRLCSGGQDGKVMLFTKSGDEVHRPWSGVAVRSGTAVRAVSLSPDGCWVCSGHKSQRKQGLVSMCCVEDETIKEHHTEREVLCVAWSPTRDYVCAGDASGTVHVFDNTLRNLCHAIVSGDSFIRSVAWSPRNDSGLYLCAANGSDKADTPIMMWELDMTQENPTIVVVDSWQHSAARSKQRV